VQSVCVAAGRVRTGWELISVQWWGQCAISMNKCGVSESWP
jgi:hypothetical protein